MAAAAHVWRTPPRPTWPCLPPQTPLVDNKEEKREMSVWKMKMTWRQNFCREVKRCYLRVNGIVSKRLSISLKNVRDVFIFKPYTLLGSLLYTVVLWPPSFAWIEKESIHKWFAITKFQNQTGKVKYKLLPFPLQCWRAHPLHRPHALQTPPSHGPFCRDKGTQSFTGRNTYQASDESHLLTIPTFAGPLGFGW